MKFGESPERALRREVREETGLSIEVIKPVGVWWFFRETDGDQVVCLTFLCWAKGEVRLDASGKEGERIAGSKWVTPAEFLSKKYPVSHPSLKKLIRDFD